MDEVIDSYYNIEILELLQQGKQPIMFDVEDYGVPAYDELIIVANKLYLAKLKIKSF